MLIDRLLFVVYFILIFPWFALAADESPSEKWSEKYNLTTDNYSDGHSNVNTVLSVLLAPPYKTGLKLKEQYDISYPERKSWVTDLHDLKKPHLWTRFFRLLPKEQKTKRSLRDVSAWAKQNLRDKVRDTKTNYVSQYSLLVRQLAEEGPITITYPDSINSDDLIRATDLVYFGGSASDGQLIVPTGHWIDAVHALGKEAYGSLYIPPSQFGGREEHRTQFFANEPYDGASGVEPRPEDQFYNKRYFVAESLAIIAHEMKLDGWLLNLEGPGDYAEQLRGFVNWFQYYTRKHLLQEQDWHQDPSLMIYVQFSSGSVLNPKDYPNMLMKLYPLSMGEFIYTQDKDKRIPLTNYAKVRVLTNNLSDRDAHIDGLETLQGKINHTFVSNHSSIELGEYGMDGRTRELISLDITMNELGGRGNKMTYTADPWGPTSFYKYDPLHNKNTGSGHRNKIRTLPFEDVAQHQPPVAPCYVPPSGRPPLCDKKISQ
ncbi:hypothetical protein [Vibrio profundi]|uniref:endo-beta-N-acetylglucosaminidase n=1 Tax=Vibrio profundi TaxID=1774960 RepID=UPI00373559DF